eukprot:TRINITY_DN14155_c0_g1_i1.p1 TRINITY_DN14155_c0_g1~~TRINITY_DN14155_c0_g1_i1.p1  ORF type:complete len:211 (-),score=20.33 TRINITY_DN14155_c0_g1_i1:27-659(-)
MVSCLRHLIHYGPIFSHIKHEMSYHSKFSALCKNTNTNLCREAWLLFSDMIINHPGALSDLIEHRILPNYTDLIDISYGNETVRYGLQAISKIFSMKSGRKEDNKLIESDIKSLNNLFIEKRIFIRLHIIYKRLISEYPAAALHELVNFYHILSSSPNCSKFYKDVLKTPEYKEGIQTLLSMLPEEQNSTKEKHKNKKQKQGEFKKKEKK